jgi:hypothetical protein
LIHSCAARGRQKEARGCHNYGSQKEPYSSLCRPPIFCRRAAKTSLNHRCAGHHCLADAAGIEPKTSWRRLLLHCIHRWAEAAGIEPKQQKELAEVAGIEPKRSCGCGSAPKTHGCGGETSSNKAKLRSGFDRRGSHKFCQIAEYAAQNYRQDSQNVGSGSKRRKSI